MIAVMIQMNQHICADNVIVQLDGNGAQVNRTIVAYQNGCSVMAKMIAAITVMNHQKIVRFVVAKQTSSARTIDAFQSKCKLP